MPQSSKKTTDPVSETPASTSAEVPKEPIMSRAARRKAKKPVVVVTEQMKEEARERRRELRKYLRMIKSNGARRKIARMRVGKRHREANEDEEAAAHFDVDARPVKRTRRE